MNDKALQLYQTSALPMGNLDAYIHRAYQIPMLTLEEEQRLTQDCFEHQDIEAARRLVLAHLRYVIKIARGYTGYGLALSDLIQEGNVGLMKAVKRFDPSFGVRLVSFAVHWIKAEIHEFVLRNWRIVKVATTKAQRKLFFNLRRAKKQLTGFTPQEAADVAKDLGVTTKEVFTMEQRLSARDLAFDARPGEDDEAFAPANYLEDHRANPAIQAEHSQWEAQNHNKLHQALQRLDERSQDILRQRWLAEDKATLHDLAAKYQVSAERIRQLEANAIKKLKQWMVGDTSVSA